MAVVQNVALNTGLTHYARGIKFGGHIADMIYPDIIADHLIGEYWQFGDGDFLVEGQGPYSLNQPYLEYEWDIDVETFKINNYGYVCRVSDLENANASNMLRLPRKKIRRGMRYLTTQKELIAMNAAYREAGYTAAVTGGSHVIDQSGAKWSAEGTDPRVNVHKAKEMIGDQIGAEGNAIILPRNAVTPLSTNPKMREGFQYVREGTLTVAALALQFEIEPQNIFIGRAIYNAAKKGQPRNMQRVWKNHAVVFYKEDMPEGDSPPEDSGFGGCFKLRGWENIRSVEQQIGNPPGMMYVLQHPYDIKVMDYRAGVMLKNVV